MTGTGTNLYSFDELITQRLFRIPDYQRGYAWTEVQLKDFWEDVRSLREGQQHYTGAITTERVAQNSLERWADESESLASSNWHDPNADHPHILNADSTITPLYIVDGQQRLLTIAIFLTAACDSNLLGESHTQRLRSQYLIRLLANDLIPVIGYEPHVPSHSYLRSTIYDNTKSEEPHTAYTAALEKAKEFFINEISELSRDELEQYIEKVTQSLVFNYQQLPAALNSYMVFETMNNRGRPLTTLELLKNRILSLIPHFPDFSTSSQNNLHATIHETWKHIYEWRVITKSCGCEHEKGGIPWV